MIDIIIPAYNAHKTIKRTLYSIMYQKNIDDFNVIIVNDNSKTDYSKEVEYFSSFYKINELKLDNNIGPSLARQYGIDHSKGKYIIFLDSDDVLYSPLSLYELYNKIENTKSDIVITDFLSQNNNNEFKTYSNTLLGLHGKIYRRSFINKNNISFLDIKGEEDTAFNNMLMLYKPKIEYYNITTYIYLYNKDSLTNKDKYLDRNIEYYIKATKLIIDNINIEIVDKYFLKELCYKSLVYSFYERYKSKELIDIYNLYKKLKDINIDEEELFLNISYKYKDRLKDYPSFNNYLKEEII